MVGQARSQALVLAHEHQNKYFVYQILALPAGRCLQPEIPGILWVAVLYPLGISRLALDGTGFIAVTKSDVLNSVSQDSLLCLIKCSRVLLDSATGP